MLIELHDDLISLIKEIDSEDDPYISSINDLLDSMRKNKHIVYVSKELLKELIDLEYIHIENKKCLYSILGRYHMFYSVINYVDYRVIVTTDNTIQVIDKYFYVPISFISDIRETNLITENESDANLYINITNYIIKHNNLSNYSIRFDNHSGHGCNVDSTLEECVNKNRLSLCIVDSDKDYINADYGSTYKTAKKVYDKRKNDSVICLDVLNVREKENLFSPEIYREFTKHHKKLFDSLYNFIDDENLIKYFDIKDGIKLSKYKNLTWRSYYEKLIEVLKNKNMFKEPGSDNTDDKFNCVLGIGGKLCDTVNDALLGDEKEYKTILENDNFINKKSALINNWRKDLSSVLPDYLYDEWIRLYRVIFSWGCCINGKIYL